MKNLQVQKIRLHLRRVALGIIRIIIENKKDLKIK